MAEDQHHGAASTDNLLSIDNLHVRFHLQTGDQDVVRGLNMRIRPGSVVALVGESGSGKSVTAQSILGLLPPIGDITDGSITFNDPQNGEVVDLASLDRDGEEIRCLRGGRIAMIFQEPMTSLSPLHTIGDQIEEALVLHQNPTRKERRGLTENMLKRVGFPNPTRAYDMYPFELSGGLRQRAMIAMALICRPALLIADEPSTALDVTIQAQILKLLKDLQQELGMAILLITHDLGVVANMADEVVVMYHGEVMEAGPVEEIFANPQHPYLKALLAAVPHFNMQDGDRLISLRDVKIDAAQLLGVDKEQGVKNSDETMLQLHNLSKAFTIRKGGFLFARSRDEQVKAVDNVSFDIKRGECFGLVGESGCGKSTIAKLIMQAMPLDSGTVIFNGKDGPVAVDDLQGEAMFAHRRNVQMVFQDPFSSLSPRMTVNNILREPLQIHGLGNAATQREMITQLMQVVGLDPRFLSRYPHSFSGGQRQRIGIARALALKPELLICDEPVSALDVSVQAQVLNLLKDLQSQLGLTYLFISHNLAVVDYMADRIAVMCKGRIVELAPRESLFHQPAHCYTKSLLQAVPYPDLSRPLALYEMQLEGASNMASWKSVFRDDNKADGSSALSHIEIAPGHFVLARRDCDAAELAA